MENTCIFCSIVKKEIKSFPVYEDNLVIAVLDVNPATEGHVIVIPKTHYNSLYEMPQDQFAYILTISRALAYALLLTQKSTNVDILYTRELIKGNMTPHAIVHLIPRYQDDTVAYNWQPSKPNEDQLSAIAAKISSAIESIKQGQQVQQKPVEQKPTEKKEEPAVKPEEEKKVEIVNSKPLIY